MPELPLNLGLKPFPAVDAVSLHAGTAAEFVNCYINELNRRQKVIGHTLLATHTLGMAIDSFYEMISGDILFTTGGKVVKLNTDNTLTDFTGDAVGTQYSYWCEDGQNVFLASGTVHAVKIDYVNFTVTLMNENTPFYPTHILNVKQFLMMNGDPPIVADTDWNESQVFGNCSSLDAVVKIDDKPGWLVCTGRRTASPLPFAKIFLSKDDGVTWSVVYTETTQRFILALEYMGNGVVLAGTGNTSGKLLRSMDYGATWTDLGQQGTSTIINFIRKMTSTVAIAGSGSGASLGKVFRSTDTGLTWGALATVFGKQCTQAEPLGSSVVIMGVISNADAFLVYRSTNDGASFALAATLATGGYMPAIQAITSSIALLAVQPIASDVKIYKTVNAGVTWTDIGVINGFDQSCLVMAFCLLSNGQLILATAGNNLTTGGAQIWKSLDQGTTWYKVQELNTAKEAAIQQNGLKECHQLGTAIATGRIDLGNDGKDTAAKWQTGIGLRAFPGDVNFSDDIGNAYSNTDSFEFFNAESVPDKVTGLFEHRGLIFAGGPRSCEINFATQNPSNPWAFSDPSLPFGLKAPNSWVSLQQEDIIMYLSEAGSMLDVVKFAGRVQQPVDQSYTALLNDSSIITSPHTAKAWIVNIRGMKHYVLSFQEDNITICYNILKDHWWRWAYWNGSSYEAAIINAGVWSSTRNTYIVGDRRANGKIYTLSGLTDAGDLIRFKLTLGNENRGTHKIKTCPEILVICKRGQTSGTAGVPETEGVFPGPVFPDPVFPGPVFPGPGGGGGVGPEPVFKFRVRDNGKPFRNFREIKMGFSGDEEFYARVNRLSAYRTRQWEFVHEDVNTDFVLADVIERFKVEKF